MKLSFYSTENVFNLVVDTKGIRVNFLSIMRSKQTKTSHVAKQVSKEM